MTKDSLVIVITIGLKGLDSNEEQDQLIAEIKKSVETTATGDVVYFYIPDFDNDKLAIECINPKLVTAELYKEAEDKLQKLNTKIDKILKKE